MCIYVCRKKALITQIAHLMAILEANRLRSHASSSTVKQARRDAAWRLGCYQGLGIWLSGFWDSLLDGKSITYSLSRFLARA